MLRYLWIVLLAAAVFGIAVFGFEILPRFAAEFRRLLLPRAPVAAELRLAGNVDRALSAKRVVRDFWEKRSGLVTRRD